MKSVVVIPTYNEAENVKPLIESIHQHVPEMDIVIVDDGSPDGTADIAAAMEGVYVIRRSGKLGLGTAYVTGYKYCLEKGYDRIGGMDADFSHNPSVLPALFGSLDHFDMAVGSRYIRGGGTRNWGLHRQLLSRTANLVARTLLSFPAKDVTSGFRAYRREVLESIDLDTIKSEGYAFVVEFMYRSVRRGFKVGETPIIFEDRRYGTSKMNSSEILGGVMNLLRLRFQKF
ncbi:MAG: dolichol-phosphate mannosyltransferase [Candidatus Hydrogenedentota bacterium]